MRLSEYAKYDATGLASLVRTGEVTAVELTRLAHQAHDELNPHINALSNSTKMLRRLLARTKGSSMVCRSFARILEPPKLDASRRREAACSKAIAPTPTAFSFVVPEPLDSALSGEQQRRSSAHPE